MRAFLIALAACSGAAPAASPAALPTAPSHGEAPLAVGAPVDVIAVLAQPAAESATIITGPAQLVLGGASLQPLDDQLLLDVDLLEQRGSDIRVGVRLDGVRFAVWTAQSRLLSVLAREQRVLVAGDAAPVEPDDPNDPVGVELHTGARVMRLDRNRDLTRVRYLGALEVEGLVPTVSLVERGPSDRRIHRFSTGKNPLLVIAGANIRVAPRWGARVLAVASYSSVIDIIKALDDGWYEVSYDDGDVHVHGFTSRRDPPSGVRRRREPEAVPHVATPDTIPNGTCLYANGEPIGVVVGQAAGTLAPSSRPGWSTFTVDTPWDAIELEVRGTVPAELATCASSTP